MHAVARCLPLLLVAVSVMGHGAVIDPPRRPGGPGRVEACGQAIEDADDKVGGTQRISALKDLPHDNSRCNVDLCKGTQFSDAQAKNTVQEYTAGQEFSMTVDIRAIHPAQSHADISIVDASTGQRIGEPLKNWDSGYGPKVEEQTYSLTMPDGLEQCSEANSCLISWFWEGHDENPTAEFADQQYNSCIDFAWKPKEGGSAPAPAPAPEDEGRDVQQKAVQPLEDEAEDEKTISIMPTSSQEESAPQPTLNINMPGDFGNAVVNDGDSRDHHYGGGGDNNPPRMNKVEEVPGVVSGESIERKEEGKDYEIVADSSAMRLSGLASLGLLAMFAVC